jgi:hypothetical protein
VITKSPNSEQSYKGKVKTHQYINRHNQSTTGKLWKRNDPELVQAFLKKWWDESDFKAANLPLSLRLKVSGCHYNSVYNNTWTKQLKQLSNQHQAQLDLFFITYLYCWCTDGVVYYDFTTIYGSCTNGVVYYDFTIRYDSCTDGVVYLVCCIYDKYEILLYSLEYVLLLVPIYQQYK